MAAVPAALQPRSQSHRNGLRQTQGAPAGDGRPHHRRPLESHRPNLRSLLPTNAQTTSTPQATDSHDRPRLLATSSSPPITDSSTSTARSRRATIRPTKVEGAHIHLRQSPVRPGTRPERRSRPAQMDGRAAGPARIDGGPDPEVDQQTAEVRLRQPLCAWRRYVAGDRRPRSSPSRKGARATFRRSR